MKHSILKGLAVVAGLGLAPTLATAQEVTIRAITAFPSALAFSKSFLGYVELVNERVNDHASPIIFELAKVLTERGLELFGTVDERLHAFVVVPVFLQVALFHREIVNFALGDLFD